MSFLAKYDETIEAAAKRLQGNWRRWECFMWWDRPADADELAIVYTSNRDADALTRSNARIIARELAPFIGGDVNAYSANHWACGHVDGFTIRVYDAKGDITPAFRRFYDLAEKIESYPVLDEFDFSNEEQEEAESVWTNCYSDSERIAYIRDHREQFEFRSFADMLGCARGRYFGGYASELLS